MNRLIQHEEVRTGDGTVEAKRCSSCRRLLPLKCYGRHPRNSDGLQSRCSQCMSRRNQPKPAEYEASA